MTPPPPKRREEQQQKIYRAYFQIYKRLFLFYNQSLLPVLAFSRPTLFFRKKSLISLRFKGYLIGSMVCSIGNGRMAVMARFLVAGRLSQNIAEEVSQQKFVTRYNCRELHESDEPNLLDEEDMHVFGLMPMTDPLDLVCCNACKKPVMASQYAAHAELCRLLNSAEEMTLELDGAIGCRKPPRKDRKKLLTASSRNSPVDVASMMDGKGVIPENTDYSACVMPPPTKRNKFISTEHRLLSDDPETAFGLAKVISTVDPFTSDIPAPLATKVYYSQRNTHLRSAVAYLHHAASSEGLQNSMMQPQASSQRGSLDAQTDGLTKEKRDPSVHQPDQILVQSSEMFVDKPGGCPAMANFSNQCPVDNVQIPQTASIGMLRSKYLPKPYSFAGKPGQSLGTMQQPSGTVPVL
uniref:SAGA-associated factor 11 n=2 Tax=Salix viminalis TaxID=40686 RepID=A0A6N2K289_SALVM